MQSSSEESLAIKTKSNGTKKNYRYNGRAVLVTWNTGKTTCNLRPDEILNYLCGGEFPRTLVYAIVCREIAPTTGNVHFHSFMQCICGFNIKGVELFKFFKEFSGVNIQPVK